MPEESEDCLYLNLWSPAAAPPPGGYPVLFWYVWRTIHSRTAANHHSGYTVEIFNWVRPVCPNTTERRSLPIVE
jgi:hypothetical protein